MRFQLLTGIYALALLTSACKTSGDIASGRDDQAAAIQTVENPALGTNDQSKDPKEISERLSMAEGELETIKANSNQEQDQLKNKIAELEKQNQTLQEELTKAKTPAPVATPPKGNQLWESALAAHKDDEHEKVIEALETLIASKPKNLFEASALLALTQYKLQAYNDSAITFNQIIDKYPKRKEAALAWFGQGCAFLKLKQKDSAQLIFGELIKRYPKSNEAGLAKKILAKKEKTPGSLFALTSHYPSLSGME